MTPSEPSTDLLAQHILAAPRSGRRRLIALAGAPASGKSTLAETLTEQLNAMGCVTEVVPMDGFHLHNRTLVDRGLLERKGAPDTFDVHGFAHLLTRLKDEEEVFFPTFDRNRDIAISGGGRIGPDCDTIVVEGNYLLFDAPDWRDLRRQWDLALRLDIPLKTLEDRLINRWLEQGLSEEDAKSRARGNDLANAETIAQATMPADITIRS